MASGTIGSSASGSPARGSTVESQQFIDQQLLKTRRQVKQVDLTARGLLLVAGVLVYLFAAALADHWLAAGGLETWARALICVGLVLGVAAYVMLAIVPLLLRDINPVFAAHTIERHTPGLKNSLINFLLLRREQQHVPAGVVEVVKQQAASRLSRVPADQAVDWRLVIRMLSVCAVVVVLAAGYMLLSPKNLLASVARIVAPWADIDPPTRVVIRDIQPGDTERFHDDFVTISAQISGLRTGEPAELIYSTADGQVVDQRVPLRWKESQYRHAAEIPGGAVGLQTDVAYRIRAGDDLSRLYTIRVRLTPSIVVDEVEYHYPAYTELPPLVMQRQGDVQALEGTTVRLRATANQEIQSRSAFLDFDRDRRSSPRLSTDGRTAQGEFVLRFKPGTQEPEHATYQLRFKNRDGVENPRPIEHRIEVVPDLPPRIAFIEATEPPPKEEVIELGRVLALAIEAADPDFKLAEVTLHLEREGDKLLEHSLLPQPRAGRVRLDHLIDTGKLSLEPGDLVVYWAEAHDNKQPKPNRAETPRYRLRIASPPAPQADGNQLARNDPQRPPEDADPRQASQRPAEPGRPADDAAPHDPQQQPGESGDAQPARRSGEGQETGQPQESRPRTAEPQERIDPDANPGEAFEELARHFERDRPSDPQPPSDQRPPAEDERPQETQQQAAPQDQQQSGDQQQPAAQQQGNERGGGESGTGGQQAEPMGDAQSNQQPGAGDRQHGGTQQSGDSPGETGQGEQRQGEQSGQPGGEATPDAQRSGQSGEQPAGDKGQQADSASAKTDAPPGASGQQPGETGQREPGTGQPAEPEGSSQQPAPGENQSHANQQQHGDSASPSESASSEGQRTPADKPQPGEGATDAKPIPPDDASGGQPGQGDKTGSSTDEAKPGESGARQDMPQDTSDARGGDELTSKGGSATEGKTGDDAATPTPQENQRPRDKTEQSTTPSMDPNRSDEASSPSTSKEESSADGDTSGDRSGDGEQGGGQPSNREGTGSAGQNTSSDEGSGAAQEPGQGETSGKPGDQATGQSGDPSAEQTAGKGQQTRPGGEQPGQGQPGEAPQQAGERPSGDSPQQPGQAPAGQPQGDQPATGEPRQQQPAGQQPDGQSAPGDHSSPPGGQTPGSPQGSAPRGDGAQPGPAQPADSGEEPGGEEANLEYARKTMDLVLDRLKDQLNSGQLDQEMLDKLRWTPEDVERFVRRWESMRAGAQQPGADGQRASEEFNRALQDLGLRPSGRSIAGGQTARDAQRNLRETRRSTPPAEYLDQTRAYTRGTSGYADPE